MINKILNFFKKQNILPTKEENLLEVQDINYFLEIEDLEESRKRLDNQERFSDYTFVNLCREGKTQAALLCLEKWDLINYEAPSNFIDSTLMFSIINEDLELFKNLLQKNLKHQSLLIFLFEKRDVKTFDFFIKYSQKNQEHSFDFLKKHPSLLTSLAKYAIKKDKQTIEFINSILFNFPSIYFYKNDFASIFKYLEEKTRHNIVSYFNEKYKFDLHPNIHQLKSVSHECSIVQIPSKENLKQDLEKIYGEKIHKPFFKKIEKEINSGDFSWVNTLYWLKDYPHIKQSNLANLSSFTITIDNKDLIQKIENVKRFLVLRTSFKQAYAILSSIESHSFYINDVYFYTNHAIFIIPRRVESRTFSALHDELGLSVQREAQKDFSLKQEELLEFLSHKKMENYSIKVPETQWQLIDIGNELKICVGTAGYGRRCLEGNIYIVMLENDLEKICVEYCRVKNRVIQARTTFNQERIHHPNVRQLENFIDELESKKEKNQRSYF